MKMRFSERYDTIAFSKLRAVEKAVLYAINRYANDDGFAEPRQEDLAPVSGLTAKGLRLVLERLRADFKVLTIGTRKASNGISDRNTYSINFEALKEVVQRAPIKRKSKQEQGTSSNRNDIPCQEGTTYPFKEVPRTSSNRNDIPLPNNIEQQPIYNSPYTTAHDHIPPKGSKTELVENFHPGDELTSPRIQKTNSLDVKKDETSGECAYSTVNKQEQTLVESSKNEVFPTSQKEGGAESEPGGVKNSSPPALRFTEKEVLWLDMVDEKWGKYRTVSKKLLTKRDVSKSVLARIKEHGIENFLLVVEWLFNDDLKNGRAEFLRSEKDGQYCSLVTLSRQSKFEQYLDFATRWKSRALNGGPNGKSEMRDDPFFGMFYSDEVQTKTVIDAIYESIGEKKLLTGGQ